MEVTGSFKFDVAKRRPEKEQELRAWIGDGRILLGGSTWPGEDEALLRLYGDLPTDVKLVIAPRHFEKADVVEAIREFIPNFAHEEKGKHLDQKM